MTYLRLVYKIAIQLISLLLRVSADFKCFSWLGNNLHFKLYTYKFKQRNTTQNKKLKHKRAPDRDIIVALLGYGWLHLGYEHMIHSFPDFALETCSEQRKLEIFRP